MLLTNALRGQGLRLTHQRSEIVKVIAKTDEHPDVEQLYQQVRETVPTVSLDTIYRTMGTLADLGLVSRVSVGSGPTRYDANAERHHHFVCTRCGLMADVSDSELDELRSPERISALGEVESVEVQFKGVCRTCAARTTTVS
ncbi:MAG: transcriptional repressor [Actinobacteria bacterium]|nr:transcriptional repressor [Actinomycetota bacterium]